MFLFLPFCILLYFGISKYFNKKSATWFLVLANLVFYGYCGTQSLIYFIGCIVINFIICKRLIYKRKKWLLALGVILNLGTLGLLKYCDFFIESLNIFIKTDFNMVNVFLPVGLSFFTFQFIALIYDCYKGNVNALNFETYMAFTTYFPKIVQGPIMTYQDFEEQYTFEENKCFKSENFARGLYALTIGLGKKILIADALALFVNPGFSTNYATYNSTMSILLMLAYTLQIYFDFSAYSDMARGISFMLNIELPRNFDSPYKALSVNSFWKRWHMSLTCFFTKYLYIPLGGNRRGELRTYFNVLIVFALSGLWHGASYTFVIWGLLHGIASAIERKWDFLSKFHVVLQWLYTFIFTNVTWLFFRCTTLTQAFHIIKNILRCDFSGIVQNDLSLIILPEIKYVFDIIHIDFIYRIYPVLFVFALLFSVLAVRNTDEQIGQFKPKVFKVLLTIVIMSWCILSFGTKITFIYEMF